MSSTTDEAREAVHKAVDRYRLSLLGPSTGAFLDAEARLTRALDAYRDAVAARAREEGAREAQAALEAERQVSQRMAEGKTKLLTENHALRNAVALAITHLTGQATKFSEREPVAVVSQLRAALSAEARP